MSLPARTILVALVLATAAAAGGLPGRPRVRTELLVTGAALEAQLADPALTILHVAGSRAGYDAGHLPGARFVALADLVETIDGIPNEMPYLDRLVGLARALGLSEDRRIVVYDEDKGLLAARAYVAMAFLGLRHRTALLDGQLRVWRREKRPLTQAVPPPAPSAFEPRMSPGVVLELRTVRDLAWQAIAGHGPAYVLVDARPEAQFTGQEAGDGVPRPGHIPTAMNVWWERNLVSAQDPRLKSVEELRELYGPRLADPTDRVVAYCRTGMQASHTFFVLDYLGHQARLFDASFLAWSRHPDTPVATGP